MKFISYLHTMAGMLVVAAAMTTFTSCSKDDDEGNGEGNGGPTTLTTPKFESVSACYEITSSSYRVNQQVQVYCKVRQNV
jgi:hypothetical protein